MKTISHSPRIDWSPVLLRLCRNRRTGSIAAMTGNHGLDSSGGGTIFFCGLVHVMDTVSNKQIITSFHLCHMLLQRNKYSKGWGEMTKGQNGKGRNDKGAK
jgi:hypothetical protein